MFEEQIEIIQEAFSKYFADGKYFVLFCIALVFLLVEEKKKENKNLLVYYPALMFVIVLNPIFCYILLKFVGQSVYYRLFWNIPMGIIIAYFGVILISKANKKVSKAIAFLAFIGIIIYSGKLVYTKWTFEKVNNWYKISDETVEVVKILQTIPMEDKKVMPPTNMVGYIRQIDASIKIVYEREPHEVYDIPVVKYYNSGDVENLTNFCKNKNTNIIIYNNAIELTISPTYFGYELYAQTQNYDIYVLTENLSSEINIDEETIPIEGLKNSYQLCVLNDLHLMKPYDDVTEKNRETVRQRYEEMFKTSIGERPYSLWKRLPTKINELNPDLVVFCGDMMDYTSSANIEALTAGMQKIQPEMMYLRADHDYGKVYNENFTKEYVKEKHQQIDENLAVYCKDLGEVLIVGIDNSTSQLTDEAIAKLREIFKLGKPIILATHVPLNSRIDNSLSEQVIANRGKNLTWDEAGSYYIAKDNTKEFLDLVFAENSPVKAVLAGHFHFKQTVKLNENITEYVLDATFKGNMSVIHIVGE